MQKQFGEVHLRIAESVRLHILATVVAVMTSVSLALAAAQL